MKSKCCVCAVFVQIVAILLVIAIIPAAYLSFEFYFKPWGEAQLSRAAANGNIVSSGRLSCPDCAGVNLEFPVSTSSGDLSSLEMYFINNGGSPVSAFASAGVALGGSSLLVSLLTGTAAASSSKSSGNLMFEALLMVNQGQFVTLLGSLNLQGAPRFFYEFCSELTWTNLLVFSPRRGAASDESGPRTLVAMVSSNNESPVKGVQRYAQLVAVSPDHLFYYTCLAVVCACGLIVALYLVLRCGVRLCKKDYESLTSRLDTRVVWATVLLLLVAQYPLAMTSCFQMYASLTSHRASGSLVLALCVLAGSCLGFVAFGVLKVSQNSPELEDLGTAAHEKKLFNRKYGAYYEDFTRTNIYFFVAKIGLEILSGAAVGLVQDPMTQIGLLVALNAAFLVLVIAREPYLVRIFYYVSILSGFLRVTLLLLTVVEISADIFPQRTRNVVAELVMGLNALLILCLLVRQVYTTTTAVYEWCQSSETFRDESSNSSGSRSWSASRRGSGTSSSKGRRSMRYEPRFTLQELIASKIRAEPSPATPPRDDGTPPSRQPYEDSSGHRFV